VNGTDGDLPDLLEREPQAKSDGRSRRRGGPLLVLLGVNVVLTSVLLIAVLARGDGGGARSGAAEADRAIGRTRAAIRAFRRDLPSAGELAEFKVMEAAQLWRRAQLVAEAGILDGSLRSRERLSSDMDELAAVIRGALPPLLREAYGKAIAEDELQNALAQWARAGAHLALFPSDGSPESAAQAQKLGYEHERVRQQILGKAQRTYNLWACTNIRKAWLDVKAENSPVSNEDNPKFQRTCVRFIGPIDSSLLDMQTGELYRELIQFVRKRMSVDTFAETVEMVEKSEKRDLDTVCREMNHGE
jgi:hypothetical protein